MPQIDLAGESLWYEVRGPAEGRDVLLVHGAGGDHRHWPAALAPLPGARLTWLDLPGHGRSGGRGRTSTEAYADVLEGFVAARGLRRVVLVGHSLGGAIVQTLALRQPDWLAGVVLVGSGFRLKVLPALLERLEADFPAAVEMLLAGLFGPAAAAASVAAERARCLDTGWRLLRDDFLACNGFDVGARLGELRVPTLVITGSADVMTPPKYAAALAAAIPGAQLQLVDGAGHLLACERPALLREALAGFLARLET